MRRTTSPSLIAAAVVITLSGCKSPQAKEAVYIPPEYVKLMDEAAKADPGMEERTGLHRAWGKPELIRQYDRIKIAVVISPRQLEESWWSRQNIRHLVSSDQDDLKYVAEYARDSFNAAFKKSKEFRLAEAPGPHTLVLEFAIVQVVPNKPILGAMSNLSSLTPIGFMVIPLKMGGKSAASDTGGAIAMESILRDSESGRIVGVFADREKGKTAIFNAKEFTAYANIRAIIDQWTANIVKALDQIREGKKVKVDPAAGFTPIDY